MSGRTTEPTLQHRLVRTEQEARDKPWLADLDEALRNNPDCEKGVMSSQGWVFSECGPNSDGENPELLVRISQGLRKAPAGYHWYGHVLYRRNDNGTGRWISVLVRTWVRPDGTGHDEVLNQWRRLVVNRVKWTSGYSQDPEDICCARDTFEEAVGALCRQIRGFRRILREERIVDHEDAGTFRVPVTEPPLQGGEQDHACMGIYGFGEALCREFLGETH